MGRSLTEPAVQHCSINSASLHSCSLQAFCRQRCWLWLFHDFGCSLACRAEILAWPGQTTSFVTNGTGESGRGTPRPMASICRGHCRRPLLLPFSSFSRSTVGAACLHWGLPDAYSRTIPLLAVGIVKAEEAQHLPEVSIFFFRDSLGTGEQGLRCSAPAGPLETGSSSGAPWHRRVSRRG